MGGGTSERDIRGLTAYDFTVSFSLHIHTILPNKQGMPGTLT